MAHHLTREHHLIQSLGLQAPISRIRETLGELLIKTGEVSGKLPWILIYPVFGEGLDDKCRSIEVNWLSY